MMDVWGRWFARVRFEALGGRFEKLLDWCVEQGVPLQEVRPTPGGFTARLPARRYKSLHRPARRFGVRLQVRERRGIWFCLRRWRGRWGLVLGPLLFLMTLELSGGLIWAVRYPGQAAAAQTRLEQSLHRMDIQPGAMPTQERLIAAEQRMMKECPELGWITLNFSDGRLVVECDQALRPDAPRQAETGRLVAAEDALLLSLNVRAGVTGKKAGQTVSAGEVLIDSVKPDRNGAAVPGSADGEAWARVKKQYECRQPLRFSARIPTGRLARGWRLEAAGHIFAPSGAEQAAEGWLMREKKNAMTLFGFALPMTQVRTLAVEYAQTELTLGEEQAAQQARWSCRRLLYEEYPDAQILAESWTQERDGDAILCRWTVEFEANIARAEQ